MQKKTPLPPEELSLGTKQFHDLLNSASDFTVVVVAVGYIDACLASLLAKHFLKGRTSEELLDSSKGPIGGFDTRAKLAYVLALIDKALFEDLQTLAKMRNYMAHSHFALGFSDERIVKYCADLSYVLRLKSAGTEENIFKAPMLAAPRNRFTITAVMIGSRLLLIALGTNHLQQQA
jgi:DNA-binding MltR family transcriptional regulator